MSDAQPAHVASDHDPSREDPPPRRTAPGSVEVWSRVTVADGLEVHIEPGRAGLSPEQVRSLVRGITSLYRQLRSDHAPGGDSAAAPSPPFAQGEQR